MPVELLIEDPDGNPRRVSPDGRRLSVGRARDNDVCFPGDGSLSRRHLVLESDGDHWSVRDLGSKNGTLLNGVAVIEPRTLSPGDRIVAGHVRIVFDPERAQVASPVRFSETSTPESGTILTSLEGVLSGETPTLDVPGERMTPETRPRWTNQAAVRALMKAGRELAMHRPSEELFRSILDLAIGAVEAERGVLLTREGKELVPRAVHGEGFDISATVRDRVLDEKTSVLVQNVLDDEVLRGRKSVLDQQIRTMMAAPLQTDAGVIGMIYVDSRFLQRQFETQDLELLTVLANHAAIRIENERLAEMKRAEELHRNELRQAAEIQARLLPQRIPQVAGLELAGKNAACRTVGGDYYDFFEYPDGRIGAVIGDVCGKGMAAALLVSNVQARVQVLAEDGGNLAEMMSRLDKLVAAQCPANRFISLFFCMLDAATGRMVYCNAGHNAPFLVRSDGKVERLEGGGTILGILPELDYEEKECFVGPGDLCLMFSDGVTEAVDRSDSEFGEDRLVEHLLACREQPTPGIVESVFERVEAWTEGRPHADDITVVAARRTK